MSHALPFVESVRDQIAETPERLDETRRRRDVARGAAEKFTGALRSAAIGGLASGQSNKPIGDGDCVVVLDRRTHTSLGPDGGGELPTSVVEKAQADIGHEIRKTYASAVVKKMKRGLLVEMHEPFPDGVDPTVDLVIALTRADASGLWIPNLDANRWDPSHPEKHVELFTAGNSVLRRARAQSTRIVKAWNKQFVEPALSSFNIAALAYEAITMPMALDVAVMTLFDHGAASLAVHRTEDPAGVSEPIKLLLPKATVIARLDDAALNVRTAVTTDDPVVAHEHMAGTFHKYLSPPPGGRSALLGSLRGGNRGLGVAGGTLAVGAGTALKRTHAFGDMRA